MASPSSPRSQSPDEIGASSAGASSGGASSGGTSGGGAPGGAWGAWATAGLWGEGLAFPGYPYLAELAQRPEYRNIVETLAEEMTRKWIKIISTGDDDKTDEAKLIEIVR